MADHAAHTDGHAAHKLEIFRGLVKFKSNTQKIWGVLIFLSLVTIVEVALGYIKPDLLNATFLKLKILNWIFIILTLVKAYYITWDFMHMRDETSGLRRAVVWTAVFLIIYLIAILLVEGEYIYEVYRDAAVSSDF
ncbi:cytochrome C oxidase subunit IV family protein [Nonlabens sp. Ci31]|jgi:cytochrome c oxidase subunit IV|uniref:cytochrome C oxidase subunit IV family protein n=1 Tax=Nonlabens sp. Ci31 TaxID=2608253 RepID=UPI0014637880|nr:cytochrome C oxidase subunit IV family protein [Nonlabens sp. Ci31]QJP33671.1 cytochrome C oxidase subunit IV family protein [Nonlabens sp. Ci31]